MFDNLQAMMKLKSAWDRFSAGHPKFPLFLDAAKRKGVPAGTVVDLKLTYPDGTVTLTNLKITPEDLAIFDSLKDLRKNL